MIIIIKSAMTNLKTLLPALAISIAPLMNSCNNVNLKDDKVVADSAEFVQKQTTTNNESNSEPTFLTAKYAGIYSFGTDVEKGAVGSFTSYPESDSTILFFLDVCRGAPSYNQGQLFGRLVIQNNNALYFSKQPYDSNGCKLKIQFKGNELTIESVEGFDECSFGGNVSADNTYHRSDSSIPKYFLNEGDTVVFKNITPEKMQALISR